jgi:hypothetical protein
MAFVVFDHFIALLGSANHRDNTLALNVVGSRVSDLSSLDETFSEEEI